MRMFATRKAQLAEIEFFLSPDIIEHQRQIYGPLDFLGDVGGLTDALVKIGACLLSMIQFITGDNLSLNLLNRIFEKENSEHIKVQQQSKIMLLNLLGMRKKFEAKPSYCFMRLLGKNKRQKGIEKGQKLIEKELDITSFLRH